VKLSMRVPFMDLAAQYQSIKRQIDEAIASTIADCAFIGGLPVQKFEQEFASLYGVKHCISCGNGTDSLFIIMKMLGLGPGDEVLTPANSWISSSETISLTGARPVFVDVDPDYFSIDENCLHSKLTPSTRAVMAVHLQGQVCQMDALQDFCKTHQLFLIEDCAQAHLSEWKGKRAGLFGCAGSFSFYPGKNLGAYGDAGCIVTDDDDLASRCRMFGRHGALVKHQHKMEGINSRMDGLQAAILSAKLPFLVGWTERRIQNAAHYNAALEGIEQIQIPQVRENSRHTFHLYVIRATSRNQLANYLSENGVETLLHYPTPLPYLEAYQHLNPRPEDFPVAWKLKDEILSLPMYPELRPDQIQYTADCIRAFYSQTP